MKEFTRCHPIVNLIFFVSVLTFAVTLMHPVCLGIALLGSVSVSLVFAGVKRTLQIVVVGIFTALATALFNVLFNHQGATALWYFPNGNILTLESLAFGVASGVMLSSVVIWFMSVNKIITPEKIICLFGGILPVISLVISMILKFVPEFIRNFKSINQGRVAIGKGEENKFIRLKKSFSAFLRVSLENGVKTADSMKARCYGSAKRTSFSNYKFTKRDAVLLCIIFIFGVLTLAGVLWGETKATYFPDIIFGKISPLTVIAYVLLSLTPLIFELWEVIRWKKLK
ncbi:MAG: energy-coupling factor transporter transmembrane protein EcfT [Clostridia bacterium]|nr:energy-coupling factor transporter transmembrane protein EcfT [Clostridia bacterium]